MVPPLREKSEGWAAWVLWTPQIQNDPDAFRRSGYTVARTFQQNFMNKKFRVFATCDIGEAIGLLRSRGYEVEVYPQPEAPPKKLILEKVKSGVDGLITTLRDSIDAEVFEAGKGLLKWSRSLRWDLTISI